MWGSLVATRRVAATGVSRRFAADPVLPVIQTKRLRAAAPVTGHLSRSRRSRMPAFRPIHSSVSRPSLHCSRPTGPRHRDARREHGRRAPTARSLSAAYRGWSRVGALSATVVRCRSRTCAWSYRLARCMTTRLSHITRSCGRQRCGPRARASPGWRRCGTRGKVKDVWSGDGGAPDAAAPAPTSRAPRR